MGNHELMILEELKCQRVDRRERIATAVLSGFVSSSNWKSKFTPTVADSVALTDLLIEELDREKI